MRFLCGPLCRSTSPHAHSCRRRSMPKNTPLGQKSLGHSDGDAAAEELFRAVFHASRTASVKQGGILIERSRCGHLSGRGTLK